MYHSIDFYSVKTGVTKNTWEDFYLIPTSRPLINPPTKKIKTVDIPGANGVLDLTDSLTGYPLYNNREGTFEFIVDNGNEKWAVLYSEIMDFFSNNVFRITLEDDPDYYYEGTCKVDSWVSNTDGTWSNLTIGYSVGPYKYEEETSSYLLLNNLNGISPISNTFVLNDIGSAPIHNVIFTVGGSDEGVTIKLNDTLTGMEREFQISNGITECADISLVPLNGNVITTCTTGVGRAFIRFRKGGL